MTATDDLRAALRADVAARDAAERAITQDITRNREAGVSWLEIGQDLGLDDGGRDRYEIAVAAYERAADRPGGFGFTCGRCGKHVRDNGPYVTSPHDREEGHSDSCERFAAMVAAYERQWDGEET